MPANPIPPVPRPVSGEPDKLLPCPFCGSTDVATNSITYSPQMMREQKWEQDTFYGVNCVVCQAMVRGIVGYQSKASAIEAWNRRAALPVVDLAIATDDERVAVLDDLLRNAYANNGRAVARADALQARLAALSRPQGRWQDDEAVRHERNGLWMTLSRSPQLPPDFFDRLDCICEAVAACSQPPQGRGEVSEEAVQGALMEAIEQGVIAAEVQYKSDIPSEYITVDYAGIVGGILAKLYESSAATLEAK